MLGMTPPTEEEKSEAIYELEDEMGHDYLTTLSQEEIERLLMQKLREKRTGKKRKKRDREEHVEKEEEPAQSYYI